MCRFLTLLACLFLFFQEKILSSEEISIVPCQAIEAIIDKVYVKPSQIYFSDHKIFAQIDKGVFEVNTLMTDAEGIYCGVKVTGYPDAWDCPKCGTHNTDRKYCSICCYWPSGGK